jgi:acetylornithine aminotransferase
MSTYNPLPVAFTHGEGVYLYDEKGKQYLDGLAGIAVNCLGYNHPALTHAVQDQAAKIMHCSNAFTIPLQIECAKKLVQVSGLESVFFCSTGAEANESMIKIARLYGKQKEIAEPAIIVMENAFHGRTMATLSASGSRKVQAGFEPLVQGFVRAPYNDLQAIHAIAKNNPNVVALMCEPLQGEGGMRVPDADYLPGLRQICDEYDWLFMLDEIQSGVGRTGKFFAFQHYDFKPDVMSLAKGLGGGVPIGACVAGPKAANLMQPGSHGTTFGGNPLASRAALTVLETIENDKILANVQRVGDYFKRQLQQHIAPLAGVVEVRGLGLWLGVEMQEKARPMQLAALEAGVLFNVAREKVIRFAPPLILQEEHVDRIVEVLREVIT